MKLLMIYASSFAFEPALKALDDAPPATGFTVQQAVLGFVHVEGMDLKNNAKVTTKLVKNLKWLAGKNDTKTIVLHSFSHLSEDKAPPQFARDILDRAEQRLKDAGYAVSQTPYGYFLNLDLQAPGHPLARVFKSF